MGCGNSKTVATVSTPSLQGHHQDQQPDNDHFETPVEDISGNHTEAGVTTGQNEAQSSGTLNDAKGGDGNAKSSPDTCAESEVVEETPVEHFSAPSDVDSYKISQETSACDEGKIRNARPPSAASTVDSVVVRAFVDDAIKKAAADPSLYPQKAGREDARPSSVASTVDSVAVRALVDHTITKVATGLAKDSSNQEQPPTGVNPEIPAEVDVNQNDHNLETDTADLKPVEDQGSGIPENGEDVGSGAGILPMTESPDDAKGTDVGSYPEPDQMNHRNTAEENQPEPLPGPANKAMCQVTDADTGEQQTRTDCEPVAVQLEPLHSSTPISAEEEKDTLDPTTIPETLPLVTGQSDGPTSLDPSHVVGNVDQTPDPASNPAPSSPEEDPGPPAFDALAQENFSRGLRSMCPLVDPKHLLDLVAPGVGVLHLERSPLPAESSFTELLTKFSDVEELNLSRNEMGPQAFRVIMMTMSANTSIKTLVLPNNKTDTNTAEMVGMMLMINKTLKSVDLSSNQLGKDYLSRCIGPALKTNTSLNSLSLSSCGATDLNALMEGLQENHSLTCLDVSHNQMSESSAFTSALAAILKKSSCAITKLNIRNCGLKGSDMQLLGEGLQENTSLTTLHAGGNEVTEIGVFTRLLLICLQHPSLETLNLNDTRSTGDGNSAVEFGPPPEKKESKLATLHVTNCSLTDDIITAVANHLPGCLPHLVELSLSGNTEMSTSTLQAVNKLVSSTGAASSTLVRLQIDQHSGLDDLPDHLTNNAPFPALTALSLCKARISPSSVGRLSELSRKPGGLTELCLSGLKLSETEALGQLLSAGANLSLNSLSLAGCSLTDSDLQPLTSALVAGWSVTSLTLANNRLTGSGINALVEAMVKPDEPAIETLNLNSNEMCDECQGALTSLLARAQNLSSLSINRNSLGIETLMAVVESLHLAESLKLLDLRHQGTSLDEDDMEVLMKMLATKLGYEVEEDEYGGIRVGCSALPSKASDLSILLTDLGVDMGPVGKALDSPMVKTDYGARHPTPLSLQHALHLGAWMTRQDPMCQPELSTASWEAIIGISKDPSVPTWLKVESLRDCAVYLSNLPANVSAGKLEGDLDSEADCNVKEVCIMKDPIQRKPNGYAWVLMADKDSVQRAMDFYSSGQALMFNQPYIISPISLKIPDLQESKGAEEKVGEEMARRERERAAEAAEHRELLAASYAASQARHEYAKAHPAYADGRIF